MVFLCTEGLIGSDYEPDPSILEGIKEILNSDLPLASRIEQVIVSALDRGEEDNISCVVMSIL
jgi:serine/threonine protein phosphatase PrpC